MTCPPCTGNCNQGRSCHAPSLISRVLRRFKSIRIAMEIEALEDAIEYQGKARESIKSAINDLRDSLAASWHWEIKAKADLEKLKAQFQEISK